MVEVTGRIQVAFTAGEIDPAMVDRTELKYYHSGALRAENVVFAPQGGFRSRPGLRRVAAVPADARALLSFVNSQGASYDIVLSPSVATIQSGASVAGTVSIPHNTGGKIDTLGAVQALDTLLLFHPDHPPHRIRQLPAGFAGDVAPITNIPNYDYGGTYSNGVAAVWDLQFITDTNSISFQIKVNDEETNAIPMGADLDDLASRIQAALLALPSIATGLTCAHVIDAGIDYFRVTFAGADNVARGDTWAVSGKIVNKPDAAVVVYKRTVGVKPGEPLMSSARGWPTTGCFYQQRLILGGFKSLPSAWMASKTGDYYNFDDRVTTSAGPMLVPMDLPGNERIERLVAGRSLMVFTSGGNYWLSDRTIANGTPPNHVKAGAEGIRPGVPVVESAGSAIFVHKQGSVIGRFSYDEVAGNFVPSDLSILAAHLVRAPKSIAIARATTSQDGDQLVVCQSDGSGLIATLQAEQDVTAFARFEVDRGLVAVGVDGENRIMAIKPDASGRSLQKLEAGLLLDDAVTLAPPGGNPASSTVYTGLDHLDGRIVWAVAANRVYGPLTCASGVVSVPAAIATTITFGTWKPPIVETMPLPRDVGPRIVRRKKARIHTVILSVLDTTSIAVQANGGRLWTATAAQLGRADDAAELAAGFTGQITMQGLTGWVDAPTVRITQTRPGRLHVRSVTIAAEL
jgi:hypothetical protein